MPKKVDREAKKEKILRAAMKIFARQGIAETKMETVAEKAGIAKGTVYEYFKSKDELLQMAFNYLIVHMNSLVRQRMAEFQEPEEKLKAGFLAYVDIESLNLNDVAQILPDLWSYGIRQKENDGDMAFDMNLIYVQYRELLGGALRKGMENGIFGQIDARAASSALMAAGDGFYLQWMADRKNFNLKKSAETFIELFMRGIKTR